MSITIDGPSPDSLLVFTSPAGVSSVVSDGNYPAESPAPRTAVLDACSDNDYSTNGPTSKTKWKTTLKWSLKTSTIPSSLDKQGAIAAVTGAARNIVNGNNDCGLADTITAKQSYLGSTSKGPGLCASGHKDGHNVVGFTALPPGELGLTCTAFINYGSGWEINEADMQLTTTLPFTLDDQCPPAVLNESPLIDVATHEFGHAFGLGHTHTGAQHEALTMYPILPCADGYVTSTLGLGDVLGLRKLY